MKMMIRFFSVIALLLCTTLASAKTLITHVDRTTINANETLELTVSYDGGSSSSDLDFSALEDNFELLSSPRLYSQRSWVNGKAESSQSWTVTLLPRSTGTLTIPSFELDGSTSTAINITVNKASSDPEKNRDKPVFIEMELDKESLYVQEQLQITYRLYTEIGLSGIDESFPDIGNTERLSIKPITYQKQLNGRNLDVVEWRYFVFPTASGTLKIPSFRVSTYSPRSRLYPSGKRFNLFSDPTELTIKPQPANSTGHWLPAFDVTLEEQPIDANMSWRVGEPLTRKVTTTAVGTSATHLPEIAIAKSDRYRSYPDQPELNQTASELGVVATRSESIAIVPTEPGILTLPPIKMQWWDTDEQQLKTAELPSVTLEVLPTQQQSYTPTPDNDNQSAVTPKPESENNWLLSLSLTGNIVLMIVVITLLLRRNKLPLTTRSTVGNNKTVSASLEKDLFAQLRRAAKEGDHKQLRELLLGWATSYWPNQSVTTLNEIGALVDNAELRKQLNALDQYLYGREDKDVDCNWIANQLKRYRANGGGKALKRDDGELKTLYST